jgi:hypothetical protein
VGRWRVYGYADDGINGVMGALDRHSDRVEFLQVRHEELSGFNKHGTIHSGSVTHVHALCAPDLR